MRGRVREGGKAWPEFREPAEKKWDEQYRPEAGIVKRHLILAALSLQERRLPFSGLRVERGPRSDLPGGLSPPPGVEQPTHTKYIVDCEYSV